MHGSRIKRANHELRPRDRLAKCSLLDLSYHSFILLVGVACFELLLILAQGYPWDPFEAC